MDKPSVSNAFIIKQETIKTGITQSNYRLKKKKKNRASQIQMEGNDKENNW